MSFQAEVIHTFQTKVPIKHRSTILAICRELLGFGGTISPASELYPFIAYLQTIHSTKTLQSFLRKYRYLQIWDQVRPHGQKSSVLRLTPIGIALLNFYSLPRPKEFSKALKRTFISRIALNSKTLTGQIWSFREMLTLFKSIASMFQYDVSTETDLELIRRIEQLIDANFDSPEFVYNAKLHCWTFHLEGQNRKGKVCTKPILR